MNIAQHIERGHHLFPDKTALIFEERSYTYKDLDLLANRFANGLRDRNIHRGDRIALFLPNIPEFIIAYLGIVKIGAVAVSLNAMLKSTEVSFILNDSGAKAIVTTAELVENVPEADLPELKHILIAEGESSKGLSLAEMMASASPDAKTIEMDRYAPAAIVYTSGTTGFPKGATLSHGNVISNSYSQNRCCGMSAEDRILLYLPLFHCFGQNAVLNAGLNACATIVLHRHFDLEKILKSVVTEQITMFFSVPTVYILLLNMGTLGYDLSSIRYYFSAAAPLPVEVAQKWFDKYQLEIHQGYGLTETSPCASYNNDFKYKVGSIGTPIENVEMKIVHADGKDALPGDLGEIIIRGPNVMLGYWNRPFETAEVIKNGWFYTGDIGQIDEDGYFYIVDRSKDMINVAGFKVYPTEVENVMYQHPAVAEVAVYGVPNLETTEIVKANIVLKPDQTVTEKQMIAFCSERMAAYKVPKAIKFVDSIPKNPTGKVLKRVLRDEAANEALVKPRSFAAKTAVAKTPAPAATPATTNNSNKGVFKALGNLFKHRN
ncbi:long-chain fatty acid--CoA ligase [Gloeocapsopsis crepidinum LEGE 06123]|uniref:Long-chain fatty acid--CoA ligase n=1 Tax=Gloeocapsopsis crepidinum LEGE 06123 TaxID=588587 RepID=A0ABR9UQD5_9CHRO|nr:long-chain fatty acid--CoA ligase [Gloeocapsopsis crepidinum]MBE9190500.1 long-chain fatty acid--CoA ligase [Gloeocapsopsis crepidinum LEGE 06123]